jgi:hypothetical protein
MDRIMMKFDDLLELKSSLDFPISDLGIVRDWAKTFSASWWEGAGGEKLKRSMSDWSFQLQGIMDDFEKLYRRIGYEVEEWATTDLKYDYEGEEIDTVKELWQLFCDVLHGDLQPGDLMMTIDIKDILGSNLPWDLRYPPEKTTVWVQVGNEWVEFDSTGPEWDLDLKIDLERKTAYLDGSWNAGSLDILASLGNGYVVGKTLSFFSIEGSGGFVGGTILGSIGGFVYTEEDFIGRNISEFDYVGIHRRLSILGLDLQIGTEGEISGFPIEAGVSPNGLSVGIPVIGEVEFGTDIDKPRDPKPPERVP